MNSGLLRKIICVIPATFVLFVVPSVLQSSIGYLVALMLFVLTLLLFWHLTQKEESSFSSSQQLTPFYKKTVPFIKSDVAVLVIYAVCIAFIAIIPLNVPLFLNWANIPILSWLRLLASLLLTGFLPGYAVLQIVDSKKQISGSARLVFSFILSFLTTMLVGLILELSGYTIDKYGFSALIITNSSIFIFQLVLKCKHNKCKLKIGSVDSVPSKNYSSALILLSLIGLQCLLLYSVFFTTQSFLRGDMWTHFSDATNLLKYGFQTDSMLSGYFWGYQIFNAAFFVLAGFPLINSEIMLVFFYPLSIIAFYSMVSIFFKDQAPKIPIIATTIWSLFSGFDWVYLVSQNLIPGKFSFDTFYHVVSKTMSGVVYPYSTFGYDHPPFVVSITTVFMLLYLFEHPKLRASVRVILIVATSFLGYAVHSPEIILFLVLFVPAFLLFSKKESVGQLRKSILAMLIGLLILLCFDFLAPGEPIYTTTYSLPLSIVILCVAFPLTYVIERIDIRNVLSKFTPHKLAKKLVVLILLIVCYPYFLSFIILSYSPLSSEGFAIGSLQHVIPWFAYPLRLGVAGILVVASAIVMLSQRKFFSEKTGFFMFVTVFAIAFAGLYATIYPNEVATTHDRIFYVMFVAVPIVAAWIFPKIFSSLEFKMHGFSLRKISKSFLACLFLVIVILGGSLSTLISSSYWAAASGPSGLPQDSMPGDIPAVAYLRTNSPSLESVVANDISTGSIQSRVTALASVQTLDSDQFKTWFGTTQPEVLFAMKNLLNVSYVYLSSEDLTTISKIYPQSFFINHLLKYLQKITFANSNISIYKIPELFPPSAGDLSIVVPSVVNENTYLSIDTFASSKLQYNLHLQQDPDNFEASTIILPFDPTPPGWRVNSIIVADDNQTNFWTATAWGENSTATPILTNENVTQVKGDDCLKIVTEKNTLGYWNIYHDYSPFVDWSGKERFCFFWLGSNSGQQFTIEIRTPDASNQHLFSFSDDFLGWKEISIPFNEFESVQSESFDLSKIERISIYPNSKDVSGIWCLDSVAASMTTYSVPESQIDEYVHWLDNGGHLVILDNYGFGYFGSYFGLKTLGYEMADSITNQKALVSMGAINVSKLAMDDANNTVVASYAFNGNPITPFSVSKIIGQGKITYVMTKSFYDNIANTSNETLRASMFLHINLTNFFDITSSSYYQSTDYQTLSSTRIGISCVNATFLGEMEISSSSLTFDDTKLNLNFKSANNLSSDYVFSNATILEIINDRPLLVNIKAPQAQSDWHPDFPESLSSDLPLKFSEGFNMTISFTNETSVTVKLKVNNSILSISMNGGIIEACASEMNSEVHFNQPKIIIKGQTFFEEAWFRRPYSVNQQFVDQGLPIELNGIASFKVPLSEGTQMYLSDFSLNGTYTVYQEDITSNLHNFFSYTAWEINWSRILLSPWNIALVIGVGILFLKLNKVQIPLHTHKKKRNLSSANN